MTNDDLRRLNDFLRDQLHLKDEEHTQLKRTIRELQEKQEQVKQGNNTN